MTHDPREALEIVQRMIEGQPMEAWITNIRTMKSLGDVVKEALTASAPKGEPCADWSDLPKDIYVIGAQRVDAVGFDIQCCSVPMVTAPEVRYVRADMISSPPPAAGWDEEVPLSKEALDAFQAGFQNQLRERHRKRFSGEPMISAEEAGLRAMLKALRRESPGPEGAVKDDLDAKIAALAHCFWSIHPSAIAAKNLTREQFYAQEMTKLIKAVRG